MAAISSLCFDSSCLSSKSYSFSTNSRSASLRFSANFFPSSSLDRRNVSCQTSYVASYPPSVDSQSQCSEDSIKFNAN
ncbi:unnamed protein product [Amaranthus hypochondriacus]